MFSIFPIGFPLVLLVFLGFLGSLLVSIGFLLDFVGFQLFFYWFLLVSRLPIGLNWVLLVSYWLSIVFLVFFWFLLVVNGVYCCSIGFYWF